MNLLYLTRLACIISSKSKKNADVAPEFAAHTAQSLIDDFPYQKSDQTFS
jgi:hypothetical protein